MKKLHDVHPPMLFKRGAVMMALDMLLGDERKQWEAAGFKREHEEEWSRILCNRIMNICSIVAEAQRRNPTVDWLAQMLWNCKAGEDAHEPAAGSTWVVTWSRELRLAQRYLSSNPDKKEWSKPLSRMAMQAMTTLWFACGLTAGSMKSRR